MEYEKIRKDILEKNFSKVPFSLSHEELSNAADTFLDFLTLPQPEKEKLSAIVDPANPETEVGYRDRSSRDGKDNKEFFHYHAYFDDTFGNDLLYADEKMLRFISEARKVYFAAKGTVEILLSVFESEFPGVSKHFFPEGRHPELYLRFLKYDTTDKGDFLAKAHYDRGTATLAIAESAPGLRIGRDDETLRPVHHEDGMALFMPGLNFHTITSKEFTPAWHDVVQDSDDRVKEDTSRWAIVLFADAFDTIPPTEEETHTMLKY